MDLTTQIRMALQSQSFPMPSIPWVQALISARNPPPPLQSLIATAKARLLATDLTTAGLLDVAVSSFPASTSNIEAAEMKLSRDIPVQVVDIENLSKSRWEQVEELEAIERGEQTRGREVIRLPVAGESEDGEADVGDVESQSGGQRTAPQAGNRAAGKNATHRLVLQDCKGQKVFALELKRIEKIGVGSTNVGEKMMLKSGAVVARGTILLEPSNCVVLGGKIEAWQKPWLEGRLARLREAVGADRPR